VIQRDGKTRFETDVPSRAVCPGSVEKGTEQDRMARSVSYSLEDEA